MSLIQSPQSCPFCGLNLTVDTHSVRRQCVDPAHWQGAGLLSSHDYYAMAKLAARGIMEMARRSNKGISTP